MALHHGPSFALLRSGHYDGAAASLSLRAAATAARDAAPLRCCAQPPIVWPQPSGASEMHTPPSPKRSHFIPSDDRRGTLAQAAYSIVSWCPPLLQKHSFPQLPHLLSAIAGNVEGQLEYTLAPRPRQEEARAPAHRPPRAGSPPCFIQASPHPAHVGSSRSRPCCSHSLRHVRAAIAGAPRCTVCQQVRGVSSMLYPVFVCARASRLALQPQSI